MINPDLQPGKPVQTRSGLEAVIYAVHEGQDCPIHGAYKDEDGKWAAIVRRANGRVWGDDVADCHDIIPAPKKLTGFINVYGGYAVGVFPTRVQADQDDRLATATRIACLDLASHNLTEGHGL